MSNIAHTKSVEKSTKKGDVKMFGKKKTVNTSNVSNSNKACGARAESNSESNKASSKATSQNATKSCSAKATGSKACGGKCKTSNKTNKTTKACS